MEGMKAIPYVALVVAISGIIIGAAIISLDSFGDTIDACHNSSFTLNESNRNGDVVCLNNTAFLSEAKGKSGTNLTNEYYSIVQSTEGQGDLAEQLPTIAIISIMVVIISIIAAVFVYLRYFA